MGQLVVIEVVSIFSKKIDAILHAHGSLLQPIGPGICWVPRASSGCYHEAVVMPFASFWFKPITPVIRIIRSRGSTTRQDLECGGIDWCINMEVI